MSILAVSVRAIYGGLHAFSDENGYIRLMSGVEFSMQMYRGQTQEYPECTPTLSRLNKIEDQLLALCRRVAFEDALDEHPMIKLAESKNLYVHRAGLAQHYGLATDMLDLTSNFDIASFFATCKWNSNTRQFEPITTQTKPGIIYCIQPHLTNMAFAAEYGYEPISILGWQPLPRPEQQRAFVVKMMPEQDFTHLATVRGYPFRHQADISQRIWNIFEGGNAIYPPDAAAELAQKAENLNEFTTSQITRAWERLSCWNKQQYNSKQQKKINQAAKIIVAKEPILNWDQYQIETNEDTLMEQFNEISKRIRYRRAMYLK